MNDVEAWLMNGFENRVKMYLVDTKDSCALISIGGNLTAAIHLTDPHKRISIVYHELPLQTLENIKEAISDSDPLGTPIEALEFLRDLWEEVQNEGGDEYQAAVEKLPTAQRVNEAKERETDCVIPNFPPETIKRLLGDLLAVQRDVHHGWSAEPQDKNLGIWNFYIFNFDKGSVLEKDFAELIKIRPQRQPRIELTIKFGPQYPHKPPFIRVVRPRFRTGHVIRGSICVSVLDTGWRPILDIEAVCEMVRALLVDPMSGSRLELSEPDGEYSEQEAEEGFQFVTGYHRRHGW